MKTKTKRKRIPRPELDRDQFKVLHALSGVQTKDVAAKSFLAYSTIAKLRRRPQDGGTRFPRHTTLVELARIAGKKWELVDADAQQTPTRQRDRAPAYGRQGAAHALAR